MTAILPLELDRLSFAVNGTTLIDDVSLTFDAGARTVILGPNGAGKSLLLRLCHGLIAPTAGRIVWHGPRAAESRRHQAMVFQRPVLLRRSVLGNVVYALRLRGLGRAAARDAALAALARVDMAGLAGRSAQTLSGGQQQALSLVRAWVTEPEVLFLDEPTSNLDPAASWRVETIIRDISESGARIVMATQDLAVARRLADDIVFLHHGRVGERGPAARLLSEPATDDLAAFLEGDLRW